MQIRATTEELELAQSTKGPLNEDFSKLVDRTLDLWKVPGIAVAVVDGPHVAHKVFFKGKSSLYASLLSFRRTSVLLEMIYWSVRELLPSQSAVVGPLQKRVKEL